MTTPKVEEKKISDLLPDSQNVNAHSQRGRGIVEHSVRKYGIGRGIVAAGKGTDTPQIIGGNLTHEIVGSLDMDDVIFVHTSGEKLVVTVRDDIAPNSPEAIALGIIDNESQKHSYNPDIDILAAVMADPAMQTLKAEDRMLADIVAGMGLKEEMKDAEPQIDRAAELQEKWQTESGQLWQLGEHRLLCGDSTKREDVERLLGGAKANMTVTSPPYFNMREYSFFETYEDYLAFIESILKEIINISDAKSFALLWNVSTDVLHEKDIPANTSLMAQSLGFRFKGDICWVKSGASSSSMRSNHIITDAHYYPLLKHEPILIFIKGDYPAFDKKDTNYVNDIIGDVWEIQQVMGSEQKKTGHNAPFPLELANRCVLSFSRTGEVVYEPFGGSGTVMMACETSGRKNYSMELSENYCAVILERFSTAFPSVEIRRLE